MLRGISDQQRTQLTLDFKQRVYKDGTWRDFSDIISLSRPSPKWVWNAQGQLVEVPADQPAYNYDPLTGESLGLLIEDESTNQILRSEELDIGPWFAVGDSSVQPNQLVAPDGTQTMDLVTLGPTSEDAFYQATNVFASVVRVEPSFFCDPNGEVGRLQLRRTGGGLGDQTGKWDIDLSIVNPGDRITRNHPAVTITQEFVTSSDSPGRVGMVFSSPDNILLTVGIWGCQIESGENPSSYISTFDAAVTRAADVATIPNLDTAEWFNQSEGTIFVEYEQGQELPRASIIGTGETGTDDWGVQESGNNERYELWNGISPSERTYIDYSALGGRPAGKIRMAFSWGSGMLRFAINGFVRENAVGFSVPPSRNTLNFFHSPYGGRAINTTTQNFRVEKRALTAAELQELTS